MNMIDIMLLCFYYRTTTRGISSDFTPIFNAIHGNHRLDIIQRIIIGSESSKKGSFSPLTLRIISWEVMRTTLSLLSNLLFLSRFWENSCSGDDDDLIQ